MNPLLISSAVSLGGKLIDSVLGNSSASKVVKAGFEQQLDKSEGKPQGSELLTFIKSQGVNSVEDLKRLDSQLVAQLKATPALADKLSAFGPGDVLSLKIEDNLISIESADGRVATLSADSEAGVLAQRIHQLRTAVASHTANPSQSLAGIVNQVSAQTPANAQWTLNPIAS